MPFSFLYNELNINEGDAIMKTNGSRILAVLLVLLFCFIPILSAMAEESETQEEIVEILPGSKGEPVRLLQERLKELGYYTKSVDGDYGNGTKTALVSFQNRNGLAETGIATVETLTLLYSEEVIGAPKAPAIEITKVSFGDTTNVTLKNNSDESINKIELMVITYDASGNVYGPVNQISMGDPGMGGLYELSNKTLKPGSTYTAPLDTRFARDMNTKYAAVAVYAYHTVSGKNYAYTPEQVYLVKSDSSIVFPSDESDPDMITDEDTTKANTVSFGASHAYISQWAAPFYKLHEGCYLQSVREGSTFDQAGLQANDVVLSFDDMPATNANSWDHAKIKMLDGEQVIVHYWRGNKEMTTIIALDMDSVVNESEPAVESNGSDIASQLSSIAALHEQGILTDEEFEAAKAKVLQ